MMSSYLLWITMASLLGFGIAAIFAGWLKLQRNIYLLFYVPPVAIYFYCFVAYNNINISELIIINWYWGLFGAVVAAVFALKNVFSQPSSMRNRGIALLSDILWPGFAYGLVDALLLSVLPILAVKLAFAPAAWATNWSGKVAIGVIALLASLVVTSIYHLGYPEFRGKKLLWPNVGNGVLSLAFLLTMNPLAAILPHIAMHIAAMIHGRETTGQVPPHYND